MKRIGIICIGVATIIMSGKCRLHNDFFDERDGNYIKMSNGDVHEEIKYKGKIRINEDETGIDHISPNGYLQFIQNDDELLIETNSHGELTYNFNDSGPKTTLDDEGKKILAKLVSEMIACGFDAEARADRIYKKGGNKALLNEIDHLYSDNVKSMYLERVLTTDSISDDESVEISKKISKDLGSDYEKEKLLNKFTASLLKSPGAAKEYLNAIQTLGSDYSKENLLSRLIDNQTVSSFDFNQFMESIDHLGSDQAKENLVRHLIERKLVVGDNYDQLFNTINHLGSDNAKSNLLRLMMDMKTAGTQFNNIIQSISALGSENEKSQLYRQLIETDNFSDDQWIAIINEATRFGSDNEKANLFVEIGKKMPANQNIKSAYMSAAKSIGSDADYGRVMKAMQ